MIRRPLTPAQLAENPRLVLERAPKIVVILLGVVAVAVGGDGVFAKVLAEQSDGSQLRVLNLKHSRLEVDVNFRRCSCGTVAFSPPPPK